MVCFTKDRSHQVRRNEIGGHAMRIDGINVRVEVFYQGHSDINTPFSHRLSGTMTLGSTMTMVKRFTLREGDIIGKL